MNYAVDPLSKIEPLVANLTFFVDNGEPPINYVTEKVSGAFSFMVKSNEYFVPLSDSIDVEAEIEKLQKELDYTKGFLKIVEGKLSNDKFVQNAPQQLVDNEKNKLADAKTKIEILAEKISALSDA
jgi:valyl-tRNA synthetase